MLAIRRWNHIPSLTSRAAEKPPRGASPHVHSEWSHPAPENRRAAFHLFDRRRKCET
jgi:hypothetical protein